jgi:hypothetical protein
MSYTCTTANSKANQCWKASFLLFQPTFPGYGLHDLIGHALVTNELRIYYLPRLKTTIRLIYFDKKIKKKFAEHHKSIIASGYKELGVIAPDFSKLSRKQCLKAIQEFEGVSTSSSMNEVIKLKEELTYGLKELRSSHIPDNWI